MFLAQRLLEQRMSKIRAPACGLFVVLIMCTFDIHAETIPWPEAPPITPLNHPETTRKALEAYRIQLEERREDAEKRRANKEMDREQYHSEIRAYKEGIQTYKEAMRENYST